MKTQKVTKSSKFTQATPNDNEYRDYQNIGLTVLPVSPNDEGNQNLERTSYAEGHDINVNKSSELLLKSNFEVYKTQERMHEIQRYSPEKNANRFAQAQDMELCNCITPVYPYKTRFADQCKSEQPAVLNRSFTSLPKLENTNLSQVSLDRKSAKYQRPKHTYVCEQNQRILRELEKGSTLRRMQSPEIINIHRGPFHAGHGSENCVVKCKEHEFRRGQSVRTVGSRSNVIQGQHHPKRRAAGDGMDAEMDDPELVFELTSTSGPHLGDCQCPCDHVVYSPTAYTTCLQIVGPADIQIISINRCPDFVDKDLQLQLNTNKHTQTISGNISLSFDIDEEVKLNIRDISATPHQNFISKDFINQRSFCKVIDNYMNGNAASEEQISQNFCPVLKGTYTLKDVSSHFSILTIPYEALGRRTFQMELIKNGELLVCREVVMESSAKNLWKI